MPAYPIPSWLRPPPDPGEEYVQAFHAGAGIAGEQARLAQQAQESQARMNIAQQEAQRDFMMKQQQIEIGKQYQQLQLGLRKQQLDTAQQKVQLATQQAANKFAAQQQYQKRFLELGGDEAAARQAAMEGGPALFSGGAGFASLTRPPKPAAQLPRWIPADPATGAPGYFVDVQTGAPHIPAAARGATGDITDKERLSYLKGLERDLAKDPAIGMPLAQVPPEMRPEVEAKQREYQQVRAQLEKLVPLGGPAAPRAAAPGPAAPAPSAMKIVRDPSGRLVVSGGSAPSTTTSTTPATRAEAPPLPAPKVTFDQFVGALKENRSAMTPAIYALGDAISDAVGYSGSAATRRGDSTLHRAGGDDFAEALLKGRSSRLPGLTGKDVEDWINRLPEEQRNAILYKAMQAGRLTE